MVVYENLFQNFNPNSVSNERLKNCSRRQPLLNYLRTSQNWQMFLQGELQENQKNARTQVLLNFNLLNP